MIGIVNVKHISGSVYEYEVRINHDVITTFQHDRREGLSKCLAEAAKAVSKQGENELINIARLLKEVEGKYAYISDKTR